MVKSIAPLVVLVLSVSCVVTQVYSKYNPGDFDFFLFVQDWPVSFCDTTTCQTNKITEQFGIHGLWPQNKDGSYPSYCSGSNFSLNAIKSLLPILDNAWYSLTGNNSDFWDHEWTKHGTCAVEGPITDQYSFFDNTLNLFNLYNITDILQRDGFSPSNSNSYSTGKLAKSIQYAVSAYPLLQCSDNNLNTVALCVDRSLSIMDCPSLSGWSCNSSNIYWPSKTQN
eukprot:TRINITY_DN405_c0_g1_i3.p1 TRINITY_DN405_c0_g1~~TRINITY_DN405_c0_g1_i3.p1  ORF type:complete len:225 (+),score=30.25 TRINITY_DN405_c0_g1_i3:106-780(+)